MGTYLNPGNEGFRQIRNGTYVDKSGLIDYVNSTIETPTKLTSFSRPRRFGKSFAAKMLCAYYGKTCDSRRLFDDLVIAKKGSYEKYLNKYDVIYLDITWFISTATDIRYIVEDLQKNVIKELVENFPDAPNEEEKSLPRVLSAIAGKTRKKFIIIIDEWDALFREAKDNEGLQKEYIQLLRGLFKGGTTTDETIAAAYMTGILPIKKYGTQSALTDFQEYTMLTPDELTEYVGFTESEVLELCEKSSVEFEEMKRWYDGYSFGDAGSIYSPNSVISAIKRKKFRSYWTSSENYESLKHYIGLNFDGLKDAIIMMLGGAKVRISTDRFQNDMTSLKSKDDILTLLVHLGYLAYDENENKVHIPNLEVAGAFQAAIEGNGWEEIEATLSQSEDLLNATICGQCETVEKILEEIHDSNFSCLKYNDENSLSCAITLAYYTARNYYEIVREFPTGKGFADYAFLPRNNTDKPAMIVELKVDKSADTAIKQIKEKRYAGRLKEYYGNLLLVGINYDKGTKKHTCVIEKA